MDTNTGLSNISISLKEVVMGLSVAVIFYWIGQVIYRLYFHPLAKFPGPKIAAATFLYELAWDYFGDGAYLFAIEEMHRKYGPIVRVNPAELSIKDAEYYNTIYVTGATRKTDAWAPFADGIGFNGSHFLTVNHNHHRLRRKPMEQFFSPAGVRRMQPVIQHLVLTFVGRLSEYSGTQKVIRLDHAFSALAGDIICALCIESPSMAFLRDVNFSPHWFNLFRTLIQSLPLFSNLPWLIKIAQLIPKRLLENIDKRSHIIRDLRDMSVDHIVEANYRKAQGHEIQHKDGGFNKCDTLFDQLVHSDLPEAELSVERLASEAQVIITAGTVTTARTMEYTTVHVLLNERIHSKLTEELRRPMVDFPEKFPNYAVLQNLPYLQACLKEGLRLGNSLMHRGPRCSPDVELVYKTWVIPKGTPVGMYVYFMHTDPGVYENPFEFRPERWLSGVTAEMEQNYVPFLSGSRNCLGVHLAYAEMLLALAAVFCPNGPKLVLHKTDETDANPACAFIVPLPRLDSKGIRVTIK